MNPVAQAGPPVTAFPHLPADQPRMLYMELFAACDMACPMCVTLPYREGRRRMMSREHIREKILEPGAARGMKRVIFGGGEPSLRKDFLDVLGDASDLGYAVWLATNLSRYDDAKLMALFQCLDKGGHTVTISYDSLVPEEMNAIRGGAFYDSVDGNLRRAVALRREHGFDVTLGATTIVQTENMLSVDATIDHVLEDIGLDFINVHPRHDYQSVTMKNFASQTPSDWCREHEHELIRTGLKLYHRAARDARVHVMGSVDDWVKFVRAPQQIARRCDAKRMLFFNAEGILRSCMFGTEFADIRTADMETILASSAYRDVRQFLDTCRICHLSCA